jgi:predicted Zn-dependent protease
MTEKTADLLAFYQKQIDDSQSVSDIIRYGYAQALLKSAQFTQARSQLEVLIEKEPERLSYQLLLADIDMAVGQVTAALDRYKDFQKLYPDDRALSLKQVQALLRVSQPGLASHILDRQLSLNGPKRETYKLLSQAKGEMGLKSQAHSALAEYYYLSGQLMSAADQLRLAADFAGQDEYQRAKIASRLRQIENDLALMEQK